MKIPKYIDTALTQRRKYACKLMETDEIITDFINKNQIDAHSEDYCGGCEMYTNPYGSETAIREAILKH